MAQSRQEIYRQLAEAAAEASNDAASYPDIAPPLGDLGRDFLAIVTASAAVGTTPNASNCQWTYTVQRARKTATGYGISKWTKDGTNITNVRNLNENINDDVAAGANPFGNGVTEDDLDPDADADDDFTLQPIPADTPVIIRPIVVHAATPSVEYWIVGGGVPNGISGSCP